MAKAKVTLRGPLSLAVGRHRFERNKPVIVRDAALIRALKLDGSFSVTDIDEKAEAEADKKKAAEAKKSAQKSVKEAKDEPEKDAKKSAQKSAQKSAKKS